MRELLIKSKSVKGGAKRCRIVRETDASFIVNLWHYGDKNWKNNETRINKLSIDIISVDGIPYQRPEGIRWRMLKHWTTGATVVSGDCPGHSIRITIIGILAEIAVENGASDRHRVEFQNIDKLKPQQFLAQMKEAAEGVLTEFKNTYRPKMTARSWQEAIMSCVA